MFKSYWDYSDRERAGFTEDEVNRMLDAELMYNGVLKPSPPPPKRDIKDLSLPVKSYAHVTLNHHAEVAFETMEQAQAFLALKPFIVDREWQVDRHFAKRPTQSDVKFSDFTDEASIALAKAELMKIKAEKDAIEKAHADFQSDMVKVSKVHNGVWEDWREQRSKLEKMQKVQRTFNEYVLMAKNKQTAIAFLLKVFTAEIIRESALWTEDVDLANEFERFDGPQAEPAPEVTTAPQQPTDDILF